MNEKTQDFLESVGAMAEMSYTFYKAFLDCSGDEDLSRFVLSTFIYATLSRDTPEDAEE